MKKLFFLLAFGLFFINYSNAQSSGSEQAKVTITKNENVKPSCKEKATCKDKVSCKDKTSCKGKANCKDKASCKGKNEETTTSDTSKSSCADKKPSCAEKKASCKSKS